MYTVKKKKIYHCTLRVFHNNGWRNNCHCSSLPWVRPHMF